MRQILLKTILCAAPIVWCGPAVADDSAAGVSATGLLPGQLPKNADAERSMMAADPIDQPVDDLDTELASTEDAVTEDTGTQTTGSAETHDKEEIWNEISDAIASLNDVVGDEMFLDLRRKNETQMEVRVDLGFWQRVRYQTRVDLKKDISNIWHLYVKQYHGSGYSAVHFIDDSTDKTIDIFTQAK